MSGLATRRQFSNIHRMLGFNPATPIRALLLRAWVLGLAWATLAHAAGRTDLRWHWSSPLPFGNNIAEIIGDTYRFYLAVADHGQAYQSDDLTQWKSLTTGTRNYLRAATFHALGSDTNAVIIVGDAGVVRISTDGLHWSSTASGATQDLQGIAANATLFVATGARGTVLTSPDALAWTRHTTPTTRFISSVVAGPSQWVAVGEAGTIWTSSDARTWIPQSSGTDRWLWRVRHLNGRYVAAGQAGTLLSSLDGIVWASSSTGITNWLYDVAAVDVTYYAVGSQGVTLTSADAVTLQIADQITAKTLYGLATLRGQLIAVGYEGAILRAQAGAFPNPPSLTQWPATPTEQLFLVQGYADQRIRLEKTSDLQNWNAEGEREITALDGSLLFLSSTTNVVDHTYFRAAERG